MKVARKFTRDNPCTKVEIHNCFFGVSEGKYIPVPLVDAKMQIGDNAPKYMEKNGYLSSELRGGLDIYSLTDDGVQWLTEGLERYLKLHPERIADVARPKAAAPRGPVVRRRVR